MLAGRGLLKLQRFQFVIPRMSQSTQAHEDDLIKVERLSNGVAILRFNNPAQLNALNEKMGNVFEQKIDALKSLFFFFFLLSFSFSRFLSFFLLQKITP